MNSSLMTFTSELQNLFVESELISILKSYYSYPALVINGSSITMLINNSRITFKENAIHDNYILKYFINDKISAYITNTHLTLIDHLTKTIEQIKVRSTNLFIWNESIIYYYKDGALYMINKNGTNIKIIDNVDIFKFKANILVYTSSANTVNIYNLETNNIKSFNVKEEISDIYVTFNKIIIETIHPIYILNTQGDILFKYDTNDPIHALCDNYLMYVDNEKINILNLNSYKIISFKHIFEYPGVCAICDTLFAISYTNKDDQKGISIFDHNGTVIDNYDIDNYLNSIKFVDIDIAQKIIFDKSLLCLF